LGEAAVEVEVEEDGGEDEHDGGGGHYGGLVPLVSVGGGEVVHRQIECSVAPFVAALGVAAVGVHLRMIEYFASTVLARASCIYVYRAG
jgi:hypothetical protein